MRARTWILWAVVILAIVVLSDWVVVRSRHAAQNAANSATESGEPDAGASGTSSGSVATGSGGDTDFAPTAIYAHNLMLRKGSTGFRVYVRWLRGQMARTAHNNNPSFDEPESFVLVIKNGVVHTNVGDLADFLNQGITNSPLTNIKLAGEGDQLKLTGTLHKVVPLPIEVISTIGVAPDNRILIRVNKINVLKIPFKKLLGGFNVSVSSMFKSGSIPGVEVQGNDILLDTAKAIPPPHIRGQLTSVRIENPDFVQVYGDTKEDLNRVEQWRNYLQLKGGTIDFGKLTMRQVDLIMVDISDNYWFDLDLSKYQDQLVNGYTRMTPEAGLQIFMPSLDKIPADKKTHSISMEWLKHRNMPPPSDITKH
jgi:hypothetical protein